jgi:hypothetical protein
MLHLYYPPSSPFLIARVMVLLVELTHAILRFAIILCQILQCLLSFSFNSNFDFCTAGRDAAFERPGSHVKAISVRMSVLRSLTSSSS